MKIYKVAVTGLFLVLVANLNLSADPSKKSLLKFWEETQKDLPGVIVFNKIDDSTYQFKTDIFPYDGEIKLLNLVIIESQTYGRESDSFFMPSHNGMVELELTNFNQELQKKYSQSYSLWAQNNTLYFDKGSSEWISQKTFQERNAQDFEKYIPNKFFSYMSTSQYYFLLPMIVYSIWVTFKSNARVKESVKISDQAFKMTQESIAMNKETNNLLSSILDELRKK